MPLQLLSESNRSMVILTCIDELIDACKPVIALTQPAATGSL